MDKILAKIQDFFKISKFELTAAALILLGLLLGLAAKTWYLEEELPDEDKNRQITALLDSLAEAEKTSYVGSDIAGNSVPELAAADTVIKKKELFPNAKKSTKAQSGDKININTASKLELTKLPGVGEKTALKIIEYRENTTFLKPEDIQKIKGIGPKKFEKMKEFIEVK
jgi:competence ComEA-like helix-hairpin-helix protein